MVFFAAHFCRSRHSRAVTGEIMMRAALALLSTLSLSVASPGGQTRAAKTLDIYIIDVEGGNAQL
jgi:hypothetical protein